MNTNLTSGTVVRHDSVWEGFPDVVYFKDKLYIAYREANRHRPTGDTFIKLISSNHLGFESAKSIVIARSKDRYNCPRIFVLDKKLYIICDLVSKCTPEQFTKVESNPKNTAVHYWCSSDGISWQGPVSTGISGIVPDRVSRTSDGLLVTTTHAKNEHGFLEASSWVSDDMNAEWKQHFLAGFRDENDKQLHLCEGSITRLEENLICLLRENSGRGEPAYCCRSKDGKTWSKPQKTKLFGCHRPVCGQLSSGNYFTTYRQSFTFDRRCWSKNIVATLTSRDSVINEKYPFYNSIQFPLDYDQNSHPDGGYTGWVEMPDGNIFIVNYIKDVAPRPFIRWYVLKERDFEVHTSVISY